MPAKLRMRDEARWIGANVAKLPSLDAAARFVGLGVKPGVADLISLHGGRFHALEIKAHGKSRVSKAQKNNFLPT